MPAAVALLTDFGLADPYVGQMRGVLARLAPGVPVLDVTHGVEPFNLAQGAFFLAASLGHFPRGTVFAAVVDPGVGGERRIVALEAAGRVVLAPDNGLAGLLLAGEGALRAYDLSAHAAAGGVSATFHGRDVFAPLAARIALGEAPELLGPELDPAGLVRLPWAAPGWDEARREARAAVLHVDRFGNCVLNLAVAPWAGRLCCGGPLTVRPGAGGALALRLVRTYGELEPGELGLLAGSQGYLEISMNQDQAARALGARCGEGLVVVQGGAPGDGGAP